MKLCIVVTATINPGDYSDIIKQDMFEARTREYQDALEFWLSLSNESLGDIVFCENSGANLDELKKQTEAYAKIIKTNREIEWISFDGNTRPKDFHYGYAELGVIDYAVKNSTLLAKYEHFTKVTGRLTFPDINKLIATLPQEFDMVADWIRFPKDGSNPRRVRTQLLFFKTAFYKKVLLDRRSQMNKNTSHTEKFLALTLWPVRAQHNLQMRFKRECQPDGTSASFGTNYRGGLSNIKSQVRGVLRVIAPGIWI